MGSRSPPRKIWWSGGLDRVEFKSGCGVKSLGQTRSGNIKPPGASLTKGTFANSSQPVDPPRTHNQDLTRTYPASLTPQVIKKRVQRNLGWLSQSLPATHTLKIHWGECSPPPPTSRQPLPPFLPASAQYSKTHFARNTKPCSLNVSAVTATN